VFETNGMVSHKPGGSFDVSHEAMLATIRSVKPLAAQNLKARFSVSSTAPGDGAVKLFMMKIVLESANDTRLRNVMQPPTRGEHKIFPTTRRRRYPP
jgi:hypothetical protein